MPDPSTVVVNVDVVTEVQIERGMRRGRRSNGECQADESALKGMMKLQTHAAERRAIADFNIENNGTEDELRQQCDAVLEAILKKYQPGG